MLALTQDERARVVDLAVRLLFADSSNEVVAVLAQDLRRRASAWAVRLKVNPRVIRVQEMSRKRGSRSSAGTVTLAVDLLDRDESFQDYVIVHELLHLRYSTHGHMFKALMSSCARLAKQSSSAT